jgi:3-oxoadipate enol-lactonase/4-carboxymuconolactone decarboxylase
VATVTHEGATIAYRVDGPPAAPTLVLANSLGTSMAMWDDQIDTLTQRFRVVRFDHRGHGGSSATPGPYSIELLGRDALAVLDGLEIEAASICGLSMGGAVAMWIAANAPRRVERLVVCCSARRFGPPEQWAARAALVRAEGPVTLLDVLMQRWFTPAMTDPGGLIRSRVRAMLETVDAEGYAGCCEALGLLDLSEQLGAIEAPTLVLSGALDPAITPEAAYDLAASIKGSSLLVLADAAHLANIEQPARVTEALLSHLCGPAAERGDRVRRRVLGDEYVDRAKQGEPTTTKDFQDLVGRVAWGEIWTRPGLDPRTRSCITVAMLVALGRLDELELHIGGAERNGVSRDEIVEVLLQAAIYCGFPAANSAFAVARKVFGDRKGD